MNEITPVLDKAVAALSGVPGVRAVVLGGSRARGTHTPDSDIDIGIYYDADALDLSALRAAATAVDDARRENRIAPPGQWGCSVRGSVAAFRAVWLARKGGRSTAPVVILHRRSVGGSLRLHARRHATWRGYSGKCGFLYVCFVWIGGPAGRGSFLSGPARRSPQS